MSINYTVDELTLTREEQARHAGTTLYNSLPRSDQLIPPVIADQVVIVSPTQGRSEMENGKISSVRRTFCLFVLFDLILIFILWVIYTQLFGGSGFELLKDQVLNYNFKTSLFDTVMLSAARFIFLILAYALFRIRHWWMIAACTLMTCGVLIAKIFLFDFDKTKSNSNPLSYCLIIISFVIAWVETWILDFKVLPYEMKMRERLLAHSQNQGYGSTLIGPRIHFPTGDDMQSVITCDNQYYSPLESPAGSDIDPDEHRSQLQPGSSQENDHKRIAKHSWEVLWSYVNSPETDWRLESDAAEKGGIIHSKKLKGVGKVYRLKAVISIPAKDLYEEMVFKPQDQPQWNPAIQTSRVLQVIDEHTDVVYNVSSQIAGGVIPNRDFVSVRTWGCRSDVYMASWVSVNHCDMPAQKHYVRGTNGVSGWVYEALPGDNRRTLFYWYMNTDIKGWLPRKLIDANMIKVIEDFCTNLQSLVTAISNS